MTIQDTCILVLPSVSSYSQGTYLLRSNLDTSNVETSLTVEGTLPHLQRLDIFLPLSFIIQNAGLGSDSQDGVLAEVNGFLRPVLQRVPSLCEISLKVPRVHAHTAHLNPDLVQGWTESVQTHSPPPHPVVVARHREDAARLSSVDSTNRLITNLLDYRFDNVETERLYRLGEF